MKAIWAMIQGELVNSSCGRAILKTLRGWWWADHAHMVIAWQRGPLYESGLRCEKCETIVTVQLGMETSTFSLAVSSP